MKTAGGGYRTLMGPFGMRYPWTAATMPHGAIDLLRGCNVRCLGCYNTQSPAVKPFKQIQDEIHLMMRHRRLQSVTLIGGEPTLHPRLIDIVRYAVSQRLRVGLLTNGVLIRPPLVKALKAAGMDVIHLHIQRTQERPDLPADAPPERWRSLREEKAAMIAREGICVGLSMIAYRSVLSEVDELVDEVLESPHVSWVLVTAYRDPLRFVELRGDLTSEIRGRPEAESTARPHEEVDQQDFLEILNRRGMRPFAHLGSSHDQHDPRWLVYGLGVARRGRSVRIVSLRSSVADRLIVRLPYWLSGRHVYYHRPYPTIFRLQLLCNALSGGRFRETLGLLLQSLRPGVRLEHKRFAFQQGPNMAQDGTVVLCRDCPDATIRNGRLVPVCIADRMAEAPAARDHQEARVA